MPESNISQTWIVEKLRLTAFPREPVGRPALGSWAQLTGSEPASSEVRPNEAMLIETGSYNGAKLTLESNPVRIEWRLTGDEKSLEQISEIPNIGSLGAVEPKFSNLMEQWLPAAPALSRIAFGAILFKPVKSVSEGYSLLDEYLPAVNIAQNGVRDLLFRINRRRRSQVAELDINRLSTWGVVTLNITTVAVSSSGVQIVPQSEQPVACRLELDINTVSEHQEELPVEVLPQLYKELAELATEISEKGDVS